MLATVLRGLVPGVPYRAEVAAATGAGVGARSAPVPIRIGESLVAAAVPMGGGVTGVAPVLGTAPPVCVPPPFPFAAPPVEQDAGPAGGSGVAGRLAELARQPAFIAGVGGACWVILAALAAWLYGRRRRKKELSHFAGNGGRSPPRHPHPGTQCPTGHPPPLSLQRPSPTRPRVSPAVPRGPGAAPRCPHPHLFPQLPSRLRCAAAPGNPPASPRDPRADRRVPLHPSPCRAAAGAGYPWLADAWRGGGVAGAAGCLGTTERYYNGEGSSRGWAPWIRGGRGQP